MPLSTWKAIALSFFCVFVVFRSVSSFPKPKASYFVGTFERKISELRQNCLGVEQIQKEINKKVTFAELFDGKELIKKLSMVIKKRFTDRIAVLQELKKGVEEDYIRSPAVKPQCCKLQSSNVKYNPRFKTNVDAGHFCEMRSKRSNEDARGLGDNVMEAMYQNLKKNHRLKWQYFGSAEGVTTIFPSSPTKNCGSYDNRARPWYINTASPIDKNIVIVLDTSTSMAAPVTTETKSSTILDVAKAAVNSVLSSLLQKDQVGVVLFSTNILLPGNDRIDTCYSERLSSASAFNINHLKKFVNGAKSGGGTLYKRGFEAAFKLLKNSPFTGSPNRRSVILFITDGPPNDVKKTVIKSIQNIKKDMKVTIVTYGIGNKIKMKSFLKSLSKKAGTIDNHVRHVTDLSAELTTYYRHLHHPRVNKAYTVSPPYLDMWGLGVLITVAMPCVRDGQFKGVAGIDITLPDLLSEIQYFSQAGPDSYAFIAHQNGNVLSHPLMSFTESKDPSLVHILSLEQEEGFKKLFQQMETAKESTVQDVMIPGQRRSVSRGGTTEEGVQEITISSHYYCSKVLDYVVCVVLAEDDVEMNFQDINAGKVFYHRMDLLPQGEICYYADSVSYREKSVVQFNGKAFRIPSEYLDINEIPANVTIYLNYINHGKGHGIFQSGIAETARMGGFLDKLWIYTGRQEYLTQVPRRFFGTFNGVLRVFPGEPLPSTYDHSNRHWYLKAKSHPDQLTFSTPYRDPLGAGIIVTVSHSITMATKAAKEKTAFGVVAADLTISYLDILIKNELGFRCKDTKSTTCFLVDSTGYIVFHPRFVQRNVYDDVAIVRSKHITEIHGHIASHLIDIGAMKKRKCQNFSERKLQIFYEVDVQDVIVQDEQKTPGRCDTFAVTRVPKTNIFVVAAFSNAYSKCYVSTSCSCGPFCNVPSNDSLCECPCTQRLDFNYCNDSAKQMNIPSCTPSNAKVASRPPLPPNTADLSKCFEQQCEKHVSEGSCRKTFGCSWCKWEDAKDLVVPFCTYDNECYGGIRGRKNPFLRIAQSVQRNLTQNVKRQAGNDGQKAIVLGGFVASFMILLLLTLISIGCYCYRKRNMNPKDEPEQHDEFNEAEMQDRMYPQGYQEGYILEGEGYIIQEPHGYEGYMEQDYPSEYPQQNEEQEYYLGEQLLPESEMFDDF